MKTVVLKYNAIIRKEGKHFIADVPSLGISDFGKTVEEAKRNIKEAIRCHVEGLMKTKTEIPAPDTEEFYLTPAEVVVRGHFTPAF